MQLIRSMELGPCTVEDPVYGLHWMGLQNHHEKIVMQLVIRTSYPWAVQGIRHPPKQPHSCIIARWEPIDPQKWSTGYYPELVMLAKTDGTGPHFVHQALQCSREWYRQSGSLNLWKMDSSYLLMLSWMDWAIEHGATPLDATGIFDAIIHERWRQ